MMLTKKMKKEQNHRIWHSKKGEPTTATTAKKKHSGRW